MQVCLSASSLNRAFLLPTHCVSTKDTCMCTLSTESSYFSLAWFLLILVCISVSLRTLFCDQTWQLLHKIVRDRNSGSASGRHIRAHGLSLEWIEGQLWTCLPCWMSHGAVELLQGCKSEAYGVDLEPLTLLSSVTGLATSYFAGIEINSWSSWRLCLPYYIPGLKGGKEMQFCGKMFVKNCAYD